MLCTEYIKQVELQVGYSLSKCLEQEIFWISDFSRFLYICIDMGMEYSLNMKFIYILCTFYNFRLTGILNNIFIVSITHHMKSVWSFPLVISWWFHTVLNFEITLISSLQSSYTQTLYRNYFNFSIFWHFPQ